MEGSYRHAMAVKATRNWREKNRDRMRTAHAISHCSAALLQCTCISRNGSPSSPFPTAPIQLSPRCTPDVAAVELKPRESNELHLRHFARTSRAVQTRHSVPSESGWGCQGISRESINGQICRGLPLRSPRVAIRLLYTVKFMSNYIQFELFLIILVLRKKLFNIYNYLLLIIYYYNYDFYCYTFGNNIYM